jgi:hypothetical protein
MDHGQLVQNHTLNIFLCFQDDCRYTHSLLVLFFAFLAAALLPLLFGSTETFGAHTAGTAQNSSIGSSQLLPFHGHQHNNSFFGVTIVVSFFLFIQS